MKIIKRKQYLDLWNELSSEKSMIFLAGPRQVGKTTLAKEIAGFFRNQVYFNWDIISDKRKIIENPTFFQDINRLDDSKPLVVFDEIHKYKDWKNYLKGIYDEFGMEYIFLVSGSGRLDLYQKGGDSLAGRYLMFHLFPFTISELSDNKRKWNKFIQNPLVNFNLNGEKKMSRIWNKLFELSGFPEPFVRGKKTFWVKWSENYHKQIIYEDIRNMADIRRIGILDLLFSLLPSKVGNPLSINSLARDLDIAFDTVKGWMELFDAAYLTFAISPWTKKISRAIRKEKKVYLFDYPLISDFGARFENMVALELFRAVTRWNELGLGSFSLHYLRDKEKREVDFLISGNNNPIFILETKSSGENFSKSLLDFQSKLNVPAIQLVNEDNIFKIRKNGYNKVLMISAPQWLASLP